MNATTTPPVITYGPSEEAWAAYPAMLQALIREQGFTRMLDIGGGANPTLPAEFIRGQQLEYTLLDISQAELDKAPPEYHKLRLDITGGTPPRGSGGYDLAFSKMLAEHVTQGEKLHQNVFALLKEGGMAVHFFPTLYAFPFVVNRLIPERLAAWLLDKLSPRDKIQQGKFPAYYSWCRGPRRSAIRRFEQLGYQVAAYHGYFGHVGYYRRVPPLRWFHQALTRWLLRNPAPLFTSYAIVVLRKPPRPGAP